MRTIQKINLNTASRDQLIHSAGFGPAAAEAIIRWREENGDFTSVDQLMNITEVDPERICDLRDHLVVSQS